MPKFITSRKKVIEQFNKVKDLGVAVAYSNKTNPTIWKILKEDTDSEVIVHSIDEAKDVAAPDRLWFFTLGTSTDTLDILFEMGVHRFVVDIPSDLDTILRYIHKNSKKIDIMLRMKLSENTIFTGKYFVFGMDGEYIKKQISVLADDEHIDKLGVHFHRKSQNVSEWSLREEIKDSLSDIFDRLDIIDIGGGIPGNYKSSHDRSLIRIFDKIKELRNFLPEHIKIYVEPGRFIAGPSTRLECNIIAIHDNNIFVDWSIYAGAIDTALTNVKLIVDGELDEHDNEQDNKLVGRLYTIKGKTPCSLDILRYKVRLPKKKVGEKIVFLNAGAYTYSSDFCYLQKVQNIIE